MSLPNDQVQTEQQTRSEPLDSASANLKSAPRWARYLYGLVASEISATTRYYDELIQLSPLAHDQGLLLHHIECPKKSLVESLESLPSVETESNHRTAVLLNGNFNYDTNIQSSLEAVKERLNRYSRVVVVLYNPYLSWLYLLLTWMGVRKGTQPTTFLTTTSLNSICRLSSYEVVRLRTTGYSPYWFFGLGGLLNRVLPLIPIIPWLAQYTDLKTFSS